MDEENSRVNGSMMWIRIVADSGLQMPRARRTVSIARKNAMTNAKLKNFVIYYYYKIKKVIILMKLIVFFVFLLYF